MGYRSTFVTEDVYFPVPTWFSDKHQNIHYGEMDGVKAFPLSSPHERKFYSGAQEELFLDIAKVLRENTERYPNEVIMVLLHEDGEIDKVIITADKIQLQGSLQYDKEYTYNSQLGDRNETYIIGEPLND